MLTIGLFPNLHKSQSKSICSLIHDFFMAHSCTVFEFPLPSEERDKVVWDKDLSNKLTSLDIALVIGGDGTVISTVRYLDHLTIPILAINLGTVGFMAQVEISNLTAALQQIVSASYSIEERSLLEAMIVSAKGNIVSTGYALNDVVLARNGHAHMISMAVQIGDTPSSLDYRADGMIIATTTGSTAYSLSAGGPVLHPAVKGIVITPICPQPFSIPSLVVSDQEQINIRLIGNSPSILVTIDGQTFTRMEAGHIIRIRSSVRCVRFINLPDWTYYHALEKKIWYNGKG